MKSYDFILYEAITKHYVTRTSLNTYRYTKMAISKELNKAIMSGHMKEVEIVIRSGRKPLTKKLYHITEDGLRYFISSCNEIIPWADLIPLPKNNSILLNTKKIRSLSPQLIFVVSILRL